MTPAERAAGDGSGTLRPLLAALRDRGDEPAVIAVGRDDVTRWSRSTLADHAERVAGGLRADGVQRGDHVALLGRSSPEWIAACLGAIGAGASAVPIDVQADARTLRLIVEDGAVGRIFTTADLLPALTDLDLDDPPAPILLDGDEADAPHWTSLSADGGAGAAGDPTPDDEAALFYTSGTTGPPKGVPLTHRNLAAQIDAVAPHAIVHEDDRVLLPLPLHHVYPFAVGLLVPLALGAPVVLPGGLTGSQIQRALREGEVTAVVGVPRLYRALVAAIEAQASRRGRLHAATLRAALAASRSLRRPGFRGGAFLLRPVRRRLAPDLRVAACGGAPLDSDLELTLEALGWRVAVGYGLTETAPLLTLKPPDIRRRGTVGRPVAGVELRIDPEAREGDARAGEILARGPNVFGGYRNRPQRSDEAFTDDGWFRTGDLGFLDGRGFLHVVGRTSTMIVTEGGENIRPQEVEEAYAASPAVREAGVLQREGALVAVIVADASAGDDAHSAIREAVEQRARSLPSYQRLADFVVSRRPLPRTRLGKIRRHELDELYDRLRREGGEAEPTGPVAREDLSPEDRALLDHPAASAVWEWLADRFADRPLTPDAGVQLDLGIDSMEWLNLTLEVRSRAGVDFPEEAVERVETVRDLLREVVEAAGRDGGEAAEADLFESPESVLSEAQQRRLRPAGRLHRTAARAGYAANRLLMRVAFRVNAQELDEALAAAGDGPAVLAPNHVSYLDPFAVAAVLPPRRLARTWWAGWRGVAFANPVSRFVSRLARVVPIDPQRGARSSLAFGAAILKRGGTLVWFPEGRRSTTGELQPFRPGLGVLLSHVPVPVVPVVIEGAGEALPPGRLRPRRVTVTVRFGAPLDPRDSGGDGEDDADRILAVLRDRMAALRQPAAPPPVRGTMCP